MIPLILKLDGDNVWPDLQEKINTDAIYHIGNDAPAIQVAVLANGMESGKPSVCIRIDLPDGKHVLAETSARLFCVAARAIMARYPNLFED
jgi:hypothetical protein